MRTKGAKNWTDQQLAEMESLFLAGWTNTEIAEYFDRSNHAIACQRSIMKKRAEDLPRSQPQPQVEPFTCYETEKGLTLFAVVMAFTLALGGLIALGGAM